jgi:hypothetical protein
MIVDWCFGLVKAVGKGTRTEQEQTLAFVKAWFAKHGDANLLLIPKRLGTAPRWPGGVRPEPRPLWQEEQRQIAHAYARLGMLARGREPGEVAKAPDFRRAMQAAADLHRDALERLGRHVGLELGR